MRARFSLVSMTLTLVVALSGCAGAPVANTISPEAAVELPPLSEVQPLVDPTTYEGPTHVLIGAPSIAPVSEKPSPVLPATVISKDLDGSRPEVTVTDTSRIIALSITGTLADLVVGLGYGDHLVGRDIATSAEGTEDLPLVTGASHTINIEAVVSLKPNVVFTDGTIGPDDVVRSQLRAAGVNVVAVDRITDFASTTQATKDIAAALGVPGLGEELASEIEQSIDAKIAEIAKLVPADEANRPRIVFLYLRGANSPFFMFGEGSGIDTIIEAVGAIDVASEAGWKGERPLSPEALPALNPDIIVVMTRGLESLGGVDDLIDSVPGVRLTNAGAHRRIIDVNDTMLFAGGTRTADLLDGLARAIYAPDSLSATVE